MRKNDFLRITANFQTPVICDDRLPLDGIIFYQVMRERYGFESSTQAGVAALADGVDKRDWMPFDVHYKNVNGENFWYYACSFARWVGTVAEGRDHWVKRFDQQFSDVIDFQGKRGKVVTQHGKYKGYRMPVFTRHVLAARWYCVGDRRELERLLPHVQSVGKKTSQGYGVVRDWQIERWHSDWSTRGPQGLMRAVPADTGIRIGFRPSYWHAPNQAICEMPADYSD